MKSLLMIILFTAGCIRQPRTLPTQDSQWGPIVKGVQLSASLSDTVVTPRSTIALSLKVKNCSKHIIAVPPNYLVMHEAPECTVELRDGSGKIHTIDYRPMVITAVLLPISIHVGETKEWTVPVDLKRDVYDPGDYTLKVTQAFTTDKMVDSKGDCILRSYDQFNLRLLSNLLNFRIKSLPLLPPGEAAKITLIEWSPESSQPSESFIARVGSLKDNLLRAKDLLGLMTNVALNPGALALRLKVVKDEKCTGVCLTLMLAPAAWAAGRSGSERWRDQPQPKRGWKREN